MIRFGTVDFGPEERKAIVRLVDGEEPMLSMGVNVRDFERRFAQWLGAKYAVMVNSGTSALETAVLAAKNVLGTEDLLTSPLSYAASWNAIMNSGVKPFFKDVEGFVIREENNFPALPVHLLGQFSDVGFPVVEDACQSMGSEHKGKKHGTFGLLSCFSFYVAHIITTIEGGMVAVNEGEHADELYETCKSIRDNGRICTCEVCGLKTVGKCDKRFTNFQGERRWASRLAGHNFKPTEFQGALGIVKMGKIDRIVERRNQIFKRYNETFHSISDEGDKIVSVAYPAKVADPQRTVKLLADLGIESRGMFLPYSSFKNAVKVSQSYVLLPMHQDLSDADVEFIIDSLQNARAVYG